MNLDFLERLRTYEADLVVPLLSKGSFLLEIGSGTGWQAKVFSERGFQVEALDLEGGPYSSHCVFPVGKFDGVNIPFPDKTFDFVFSSSVLEHVLDLLALDAEIKRVLKPDGIAVHILPSPIWRIWTSIVYYLKMITEPWVLLKEPFPPRHGEKGNAFSEIYYFSSHYWSKSFKEMRWKLKKNYPNQLFYTGHMILNSKLSIPVRRTLSRILGSVCRIYFLKKTDHDTAE